MTIEYKKLAATRKDELKTAQLGTMPDKASTEGVRVPPANAFINTTPYGLKVKMPDSVHVFLPGETIEFTEKVLGPGDVEKELSRRDRRLVMKREASLRISRAKKGK